MRTVFFPSQWSAADFLAAYITLPIFFALYLGHKIYFAFYQSRKSGSGFFGSFLFATRTHDIDVTTGKREMDQLEAMDVPPVSKNVWQKIWFWIA